MRAQAVIGSVLSLLACSGTRVHVQPDYAGRPIKNATLAIVASAYGVEWEPEVPRSGLSDRRLNTLLGSGAPTGLEKQLVERGGFSAVTISRATSELETRQLAVPDGHRSYEVPIHLPLDGAPATLAAGTPGFVLFLERARLGYRDPPPQVVGPPGAGTQTDPPPELVYRVVFAFWDQAAGALVCYGRAEIAIDVDQGLTAELEAAFADQLAAELLRKSPFR